MIPGSANPLLLKSAAATPGGLQISRSLRFNSSDSGFLSRTPAVAGNRRTWTWSGWVKRSTLGTIQQFFTCSASGYGSNWSILQFNSSDKLGVFFGIGSNPDLLTTAVYRDLSAWMHVLINCDTTQATAANRGAIYVNGVKITAFDIETYRTQNFDTDINTTSAHDLGRQSTGAYYTDGYLANIHFIDGQQLTPSSFTETDATTGQLIPKTYTGSYGTNGFNLLFADNSSNTASTLGKDTSGNSNNWTPNNLSVTAGAGNDSLVDSPTNYGTDTGVGGSVRGNYCTLNPLRANSSHTLSNGNLDIALGGAGATTTFATFGVSTGKWYWEMTCGTQISYYPSPGVNTNLSASVANQSGADATGYQYMANGQKFNAATLTAYGASFTTNDVIGIALDMDAGTITFYKNGTTQGQAYSGISGTAVPTVIGVSASAVFNFGQRAFAYTVPSGFKAICTQNLPAPLVTKSNTVMDVALYTGNGAARSITGLAFNPDLVWIKSRSAATDNKLTDSVRGVTKGLISNTTGAETTDTNGLTAFNSDGFSLGTDTVYNNNAATYVAWCWDAGTSTVSNTSGSITSQVRANATAGFSVVTYTAGATNATVGHGLGVAPGLIIAKSRTNAADWVVYHSSLGKDGYLHLNLTNVFASNSNYWGITGPNSTTFGLATSGFSNNSGNMVAYCFSPVVGYSSFGSYVGNGSSDGVFVYTGMRPRWILTKRTDTSGEWVIFDTARNSSNQSQKWLLPNASNAEGDDAGVAAGKQMDILSNGFKFRGTSVGVNASASTYIYAAFAEAPLNYSRAR